MIYEARGSPLARPTVWRLEGDCLLETGSHQRRHQLAELKRVWLTRRGLGGQVYLVLTISRRRIVIRSHSHEGVRRFTDQRQAFAQFTRALLASAAVEAPKARYRTDPGAFDVILAIGMVWGGVIGLTPVLAGSLGQPALGWDLAARMTFGLCLLFAVALWLPRDQRRFDPRNVPDRVLGL